MRGGYRPGAGRKVGFAAKKSEEARKVFAELTENEVKPIAEALIQKAKKGDVAAAKELFDRAWGRAVQATEISGPHGTPILPPPILDLSVATEPNP